MIEWLITYLLDSLPDLAFLNDNMDNISVPLDWLCWVNYYLPFDTFLTCCTFIVGLYIVGGVVRVLIDVL